MVYMGRVPKIKETDFFRQYGKYFKFHMEHPSLEQFFMLITLLLFYMMISAYIKRIDAKNVENRIIGFFRVRIKEQ